MRSLFLDTKRPSKLPKYPKRRNISQTGKISLIKKSLISVESRKKLANSLKIFKKQLHSQFFHFKSQSKRFWTCKKIKTLKIWKRFQIVQKKYLKLVTTPFPNYLKICATFEKYRIFKIFSAFE
jgi:hypothetical protein